MAGLPVGTVTLLCADIEGTTELRERLGDRYADVLATCRRLLRTAVHTQGGRELGTLGDGLSYAFPRGRSAVAATVAGSEAVNRYPWPGRTSVRVRMGLHTGEAPSADAGYVGTDVYRATGICAAAHGGQILISQTTRDRVGNDLPKAITFHDLGVHRLKDLAPPQHVFQLMHPHLPAEFPPLRSLEMRPHNLPPQLTSFVGREREILDVKRFLSTTRLLTLTGSGGAGKSRLAFHVAAEALEDFTDGVWVAELASIADPALVPQATASALSVSEQPGRPLVDTLTDALRHKSLLLVLDNCEHLQSACVHLADALLRRCLNLRILATSRVPLGLSGETLWRVPSLSLPDPQRLPPLDQMQRYEAVRLFVERVRSGQPRFTLTLDAAPAIAQICHKLDGIPMAIELAAARARALAVEQIASRLDDRFRLLTQGSPTALPRHRTLRATMDWSYDLLSETERVMLRRLSVFAGGWTLEAAETVCSGDSVERTDVLDLLTNLVDKSLVIADTHGGEARYRFHETVRQYGRDRLHDAGQTASVRRRHRDWYLRFAERAEANLHGPEQGSWFERLETEHDNLRAGLEYSKAEEDDATAEVRFAAALQWSWFLHGHWSEGLAWLEGALARSDKAPPASLPKVLLGVGRITWFQGGADRAAPIFERGLALCRDLGDTEVIPGFFYWVGRRASRQGDFTRATALLEEGLALCRERGDTWWASQLLAERGDLEQYRGDYEAAATFYLEGLALSRRTGGINNTMLFLHNLGCVALHQGDIEKAAAYYVECLILCRQVRHKLITAGCLEGVTAVASDHRNHERAARLFAAAQGFQETLGSGGARYPAAQAPYDRRVASTRAGLGDAAFAAASVAGRAMTMEQAVEYALQSVGATPLPPTAQERVTQRAPADLLTAREREVAALVAQGLTNRQIASMLVVTERTAETHLQNILNKLGFTSRAQVAAWATEHGLHMPAKG